jgi:hypothetical protein
MRTLVEVGQELVFVNHQTGRRIPVKVLGVGTPYSSSVCVAQVADPSKVRTVRTSDLRTASGGMVATQAQLEESAKYAPLNAALAAADRYACLECGAKHHHRTCPNCGSTDRIENV